MAESDYSRKHEPSSIHVRTMHLTLIFIVIISYSTAYSHPLLSNELHQKPQQHELKIESRQKEELNSTTSRPLQQFLKKILSAFSFRSSSTTTMIPTTTTQRTYAEPIYYQKPELQEIPNFVDFSTYLLDAFKKHNSAISFSYLDPNVTNLRGGNYSVITFLIPHSLQDKIPMKGFFGQFINLFRFPWSRQPTPPTDTVYSNFPPFLEYFAQRIQAYYSIYKYPDDSRLNNTIVFELPDNDDLNGEQPISDDIIETTTDYLTTTDYSATTNDPTTIINDLSENENLLVGTTTITTGSSA